jgi:hypothetical protein
MALKPIGYRVGDFIVAPTDDGKYASIEEPEGRVEVPLEYVAHIIEALNQVVRDAQQ